MENLTVQENEVMELLTKGLTNKEIASKMNLSVHTIKSHLESIYNKLEVLNRVQAAVAAVTAKKD